MIIHRQKTQINYKLITSVEERRKLDEYKRHGIKWNVQFLNHERMSKEINFKAVCMLRPTKMTMIMFTNGSLLSV